MQPTGWVATFVLVSALPVLGADTWSQEVPDLVVERMLTVQERTVRVSLFSNRVAVLSERSDGEQVLLRMVTLSEGEMQGYAAAVERDRQLAHDISSRPLDGVGGRGVIRLPRSDGGVREVAYSPGVMLDLHMARLVAALDDLERRVRDAGPGAEALLGWSPEPGDVVELVGGGLARVTDVREDSVVLAHLSAALVEEVARSQLAQRVLRVVRE